VRAEDRYSWLDEKAAELLLRGQPVAAQGVRDAERLAGALDGITVPFESQREMRGEAAAVAAFREARSQVPRGAGVTPRSARNQRASHLSLVGRPLRLGLTVALAGCALGGAAVAATTGMLPTPFGGGGGGGGGSGLKPVSSTASPQSPDGGGATGPGAGGPRTPGRNDGRALPTGPGTSGGSGSGSRDTAGAGHGSDGRPGPADAMRGTPTDPPPSGGWDQRVVALCMSYVNDDLGRGERRRLEAKAGGGAKVPRYCQWHGGGSASPKGSGNPDAMGNSGGPGDNGGGGDRGGGGDEKAGGAAHPGGDRVPGDRGRGNDGH
jgi:hypothetical protein